MSIKVKSGEIKAGNEYYSRGDIVTGIDPKEEEKLIAVGVAEYVPEPKEETDADPENNGGAGKGKAK